MSGKRKPEEGTDGREEGAKRKLDTSPGSSSAEASAVLPSPTPTPTPTPTPDLSAFPSTAPPPPSSTFPFPAAGESTVRPIHKESSSADARTIHFCDWKPSLVFGQLNPRSVHQDAAIATGGSSSLPIQKGSSSPAVGTIRFHGWPPLPEIGDLAPRIVYQDTAIAAGGSSSRPTADCWSPIREELASSTCFEIVRSARDPRLPTPPRPIGAPAYRPQPMSGERRVQKYAVYRRGRFVVTQPLPDSFEPGQELPPLFPRPYRISSAHSPAPNDPMITGDSSDQGNRLPKEESEGLDLCDRLRNVRIDDVENRAYLILQEARGMLSYIENQLIPVQIMQSRMQPLLNHISETSRSLTEILSQRNIGSSSSSSSSHTGTSSPFIRQTVDGLEAMLPWLVQWINAMMVETPPNIMTFINSSKPHLHSNILQFLAYISSKAMNVHRLVQSLKKEYPGAD